MGKLIVNLDRISSSVPDSLAQFGECECFEAPDGSKVTRLPTASLPLRNLVEANWDPASCVECGNTRSVVEVDRLVDGSPAEIFVKSPERTFSASHPHNLWWGGKKSGETPIRLHDSLVEEQVDWEAAILMGLTRTNIKSEVPQAVIEIQGEQRLVVMAIPSSTLNSPKLVGLTQTAIQHKIRAAGFHDVDFLHSSNAFMGADGFIHVIDVNRWEWPGKIDRFRNALRERLIQAINKKSK